MSNLINKYLSSVELDNLKILENAISNKLVSVTCMGLYNHGKSSLLNVLVKDFGDTTFKTADIRETTKNQKLDFNGITFIDTPGLNANKDDDKRVFDAVKESDINIFVHTVTAGEFTEKEIEFLNKIKNYWQNPQEFISRTIFVLSRIDKANNDEDIVITINKMKLQINEIFASEAFIIPISAMRYKNGTINSKKILIKKSNVEILENRIKELREKYLNVILETRILRLHNTYNELINKFESRRQERIFELSKRNQAKNEFFMNFNNDIMRIEETLEKMYSRLEE